jgi:hypothetical protein
MSELHLDNWTSCHLALMGTGSTHIITLRFHGRGWRFIVYDGKRHLFSTMPEGPKGTIWLCLELDCVAFYIHPGLSLAKSSQSINHSYQ